MTRFLTAPVLYALAALSLVLGGIAALQSYRLQVAKADRAETLAEVARDARVVAEQSAQLAVQAAEAKATYHNEKGVAAATRAQEMNDAYERGRRTGAAIAAGTQRVRDVWRDRCPQANAWQGTELAGGFALVDRGRADAIGRVLGLAGGFDAQYSEAIARLKAAQGLLNVCYERPAEVKP
ncbi:MULTISPECIES: hypothetical protein [unclassified Pseudoxanthomonas]|uniref:hypothetical protein n=1 Tax=unclassified Pseudoxanthomonas TaxID=2645906 RepID=UPI00307D1362